ncbi:calcium/sodium antiporter [Bacillus carboniphilus]|uniref:Calcium/sodium antiporter n=1 Tax=Bacillus carboniphilus TaxID=86663 RepID=A0ABY9JTJ1_9BACI|nr:calcium/sodium antiporter [Bacillus carboniphilus]WLR42068.1 calcium/sodium antiporter [Bacillus carboniphilus]
MTYLLLLIGFVLLIKGADFFVDGSSHIARALHISPLIIGLTIVSLGTSSPEATISILAAIEGSAGVSLGNIVGSNILNTTLIIGLTALVFPLKVEDETIKKEIPFTLLGSVAFLVLVSDLFFRNSNINMLSNSDGLILLLFLLIFFSYIFEVAKSSRKQRKEKNKQEKTPARTWGKYIGITIMGLIAIIIGGELVVRSATSIAFSFGLSETLIGLTVIAIGSSLPELVTSISAAIKKQSEIVLGNIVGSNIFNILFVLGTTAAITPLPVENKIFTDIFIMLALTLLLLLFSRTKYKIGKAEGLILVLTYLIYMIYIIIRN